MPSLGASLSGACAAILLEGVGRAQTTPQEFSLAPTSIDGPYPQDVAVKNNGNLAVVRMASDRVELHTTFGVSIGSGSSGLHAPVHFQGDETYLELLNVSGSGSLIKQFVFPTTPPANATAWEYEHAGYANDLGITRDGAWAVVNSDNWIHVLKLDPLSGYPVTEFNIGKYTYTSPEDPGQWNRPCTPNQAVDSVLVTNDRAIITTARKRPSDDPSPTQADVYTTWVYILDLSAANGPKIVLEHDLAPPKGWEVTGDDHDRPHDVEITPLAQVLEGAAQLAVVTTNHSVAVYNLDTNTFLNRHFDAAVTRTYQVQVDSVEMTADRAVVISDDVTGAVTRWRAEIFALSKTDGFESLPNGGFAFSAPNSNPNGTLFERYWSTDDENHDRAHDLAVNREFDMALVRTSLNNVVVDSMQDPPTLLLAPILPSPNGSNAHAYREFTQAGFHSFSSDSVVMTKVVEEEGPKLRAATIGGSQPSGAGPYRGHVDLIELSPAIAMTQVIVTSHAGSDAGCVPLDLAISHDKTSLVVRSSDPEYFGPGMPTTEADLVTIAFAPGGAITARYPGHGQCMALDSLAAPASGFVKTDKRVLSVSQDPPPLTLGQDYIHIVN